jgi:hypothetical protein
VAGRGRGRQLSRRVVESGSRCSRRVGGIVAWRESGRRGRRGVGGVGASGESGRRGVGGVGASGSSGRRGRRGVGASGGGESGVGESGRGEVKCYSAKQKRRDMNHGCPKSVFSFLHFCTTYGLSSFNKVLCTHTCTSPQISLSSQILSKTVASTLKWL